jgi:hypothetical protein
MGGGNEMVKIAEYPQLKLIAWSYRKDGELDDREALALYEGNWRFVDQDGLTPRERALIERLKREYGKGVLNV